MPQAMRRTFLAALILALGGCVSAPPLPPYIAATLVTVPDSACPADASGSDDLVPQGLAFVRSEGADTLLVAAQRCVLTVDPASGRAAPLALRGNLSQPVMLDASSEGIALSSPKTGAALRIQLEEETTTTESLSGFSNPLGIRLLPGGSILVAEHGAGRVLRVGPTAESRAVTLVEGLAGPVALVVASATTAYVSEQEAGRITRFALRTGERSTVAENLSQPEGIALLADGRLVVAETGLRRIVAIDLTSGRREVLAANLPIGTASGNGAITDVAVGPDGALYASAGTDRSVLKLSRRPQ